MATRWVYWANLIFWLLAISPAQLFADQPPLGIILDQASLDQMLRSRGAAAIFSQAQGQIVEEIRKALQEAERLQPILQGAHFPDLHSQSEEWLAEIRKVYDSSLSPPEVEEEMRAWRSFFDELKKLDPDDDPEKAQATVDEFFNQGPAELHIPSRKSVLPLQIPLFQTGYNINDTNNVNLTRNLLRRPILQVDHLNDMLSRRDEWMQSVEQAYRSSRETLSEDKINAELQAWNRFFSRLESLDRSQPNLDEEDFIREFFESKIHSESQLARLDLLPTSIPLFKRQKTVWVDSLREVYSKNVPPGEMGWVNESIENWSRIFDEMEDWYLFVSYDINFYPNFQSLDLQYRFNQQGPLVHALAELPMQPTLHLRSISISFQNPTTGEFIHLDMPEFYNAIWKFSDELRLKVGMNIDHDLQRDQVMDFQIGPAQTNLRDLTIKSGDFIQDVFERSIRAFKKTKSNGDATVDESFGQQGSIDRMVSQLRSDIQNYLKYEKLEIAVWLVRTSDGEIKTEIGVLDDELRDRLTQLRATSQNKQTRGDQLVAEFHTEIPLELASSHFDIDLESETIIFDGDFLESRELRWRSPYFEFPSFLLGEIEDPMAQRLVAGFQGRNLAQDTFDIRSEIHFPPMPNGQRGLKLRAPIKWLVDEDGFRIPQVDSEKVHVELPGLRSAYLKNARFRANENLPWVEFDFKDPRRMSDQAYVQLPAIMQNIEAIVGDDTLELVETEVVQLINGRLSNLEASLPSDNPVPMAPPLLKVLGFELAEDAVAIDWEAEAEWNTSRLDPKLHPEYERIRAEISEQYRQASTYLPNNVRFNKKKNRWEREHVEVRRRVVGPNTFVENPTYEVRSWVEISTKELLAIRNERIERETENVFRRRYRSGFDLLPSSYKVYENIPALHWVRTRVKLPKEFRVRLENHQTDEAYIEELEFSLRAEKEPELEVYWKFVQDSQGQLLMIPALLNLESVLEAYQPVTSGPPENGGPLIRGINPRSGLGRHASRAADAVGTFGENVSEAGRTARVIGQVIGQIGFGSWWERSAQRTLEAAGIVGGTVAEFGGQRIQGAEAGFETIEANVAAGKLEEAWREESSKLSGQLAEILVERANGYLMRDMADISSVGSDEERIQIRKDAALRALQIAFENVLETKIVDKFQLRGPIGQMIFEDENVVRAAEQKITEVIVETVEGKGPIKSWPETFTNPGIGGQFQEIRDAAEERVANLPRAQADLIEGDPQSPAPNTLNSALQGPVHDSGEEALNAPFENIQMGGSSEKDDSVYPSEAGPFVAHLPEFLCIGGPDASPSEDLLAIWASHEAKESSHLSQNPAPHLNPLIQSVFEDRPEWNYRKPDAVVVMSLEDLHQNLIEPNLQAARLTLNEELRKTQPGTELELGNAQILHERSAKGSDQVYALVELRLRSKKGLITFDSGAEFLQVKMPLELSVGSTRDDRPEFEGDEIRPGYFISARGGFPVEIIDPNSGNIVDHWIKKYIAYPQLANALVYEPEVKDPITKTRTQQARTIHIPIKQSFGLPGAERDVRLDIRGVQVRRDAEGRSQLVGLLDFKHSDREIPTEGRIRMDADARRAQAQLEDYISENLQHPDFVFRRMFENLLKHSDDEVRQFKRNEAITVAFEKPRSRLAPNPENPGQLMFVTSLQFWQQGEKNIRVFRSIEMSIPFDHYERDGQLVIDPHELRVSSWPDREQLNEASIDFLNYLKTVNPEALNLSGFQP